MPELPEVETVRRTLQPLLTGRTISGFELFWHRTLEGQEADVVAQRISGRTVTAVGRRGKLLLVHLDDGSAVTIHLRMTGELLILDNRDARDPSRERYLRAVIHFTDGGALLFYDVRKFGKIRHREAADLAALDGTVGLEPLAASFDPEALAGTLRRRRRQIKALLLDQTVIAGLGNIYVDEALFQARLHPQRASDGLTDSEVAALHAAIVGILSSAVEHQGTTLRDYRIGTGESGGNRPRLRIYGTRPGAPCPECGTAVERILIAQRGTVFCPSCQPLRPSDTPDR